MMYLNLIPNNYDFLSFKDLLFFAGISILMVVILGLLSKLIGKVSPKLDGLNNPIYQTQDILLQHKNVEIANFPTEKTTSIWVKFLLFILIGFVVFTPLYQLLGVDYFL